MPVIEEGIIECPICDFDYNHIKEVEFIPDGDIGAGIPVYLSSARGSGEAYIKVGTRRVPAFGRGKQVTLRFECESRHRWSVSYSFHKGNVRRHVHHNYDEDAEISRQIEDAEIDRQIEDDAIEQSIRRSALERTFLRRRGDLDKS